MDNSSSNLTLDKILTIRQWRKLSRELERVKDGPDYYFCWLTWMTGLRVSELTNLKWLDVDLDDQFLKVREGKGAKPRTIYFGPKTTKILFEYKEKKSPRKDNEYIFISQKRTPFSRVTIHRRFKELLRRSALPEGLSFHSLRHGYATRMLDEGIQLHELKNQLGHTSIATTAIYLHFTESSREKFAKIC